MIRALQQRLTSIYDLPESQDIRHFLIDSQTYRTFTEQHGLDPHATEQLLILSGENQSIDVSLFLHDEVLANLSEHDPERGLNAFNFSDFCTAVEGVSHFLFLEHRARHDFHLSALELELQAEIDKFIAALVYPGGEAQGMEHAEGAFNSIFRSFRWRENLAASEEERYRLASEVAERFCYRLLKHHIDENPDWPALFRFLRQFYRKDWGAKVSAITQSSDGFPIF